MVLNEMEKWQLFQVEGDSQTKVLDELYHTARYTTDPEQRKAAQSLSEKLRGLSAEDCMNLVKDIQSNYKLPYPPRTVGEMILAVGSGFLLTRDLMQYIQGADAYEDLAEHVKIPDPAAGDEGSPADDPAGLLPEVDFDALRETVPDIIGWLNLPDTEINYPVTQTGDNEYYLDHLCDGTYSKVGSLFVDYENQADFSDRNAIIYDHNMRDGSMCALLNEYDSQAFYEEHPRMYLVTPEGGYEVEIFAAFAAAPSESGSDDSSWRLEWKDDGDYTTWITSMKERSLIETDVTVTGSDQVLTLSTCTPGGKNRFLVMGTMTEVEE